MRISDWSSDVCSSDHVIFLGMSRLIMVGALADAKRLAGQADTGFKVLNGTARHLFASRWRYHFFRSASCTISAFRRSSAYIFRSEEHTSELQSLMRISYAVFCLKKKNIHE